MVNLSCRKMCLQQNKQSTARKFLAVQIFIEEVEIMTAKMIFDLFYGLVQTPEGRTLYALSVLCVLMIVDFLVGTAAAWINPNIKFSSNVGINGIIRKLVSILIFIVCIPLSVLIPGNVGVVALYVLYTGYILMEFTSIIENLGKMGASVNGLQDFLKRITEKGEK